MQVRVGGYAVVVEARGVLLAYWRQRQLWTVPGGGIDPGEDPADATVRELMEETGYEVVLDGVVGVDSEVIPAQMRSDGAPGDLQMIRVVHRARVVGGSLRDEADGSTDRAAWFALDEVARLPRVPFVDTALRMSGAQRTPWGLTFDCISAGGQAAFWALALGYVPAPVPVGFMSWEARLTHFDVPRQEWDDGASIADPGGVLPTVSFLRVREGKTVKNRIHLDVKVAGRAMRPDARWALVRAKVDELVAAGATVLRQHDHDGGGDHVVLADPEGNEFCVL